VQEVAFFKQEKTPSGLKVRSRPKSKTRRQQGRNGIAKISRKSRGEVVSMDKVTGRGEGRGTKRGAEAAENQDAQCWQRYELLQRGRAGGRQTLADICRQHKPQPLPEKCFVVPEERISSAA